MIDFRYELLRLWYGVVYFARLLLGVSLFFVDVLLLPTPWVRKPQR